MITQEQETRETTPATVLDQVLEASQVLSEFTNPSYVEELITGPLTEATEPHVDLSDVESDLDADQEYYAQVLKLREQIERDEALREAAEDVIATWQDYRLSLRLLTRWPSSWRSTAFHRSPARWSFVRSSRRSEDPAPSSRSTVPPCAHCRGGGT